MWRKSLAYHSAQYIFATVVIIWCTLIRMDFIIFTSTKYLAFWTLYYSLNMKKILNSAERISGMHKQERLSKGGPSDHTVALLALKLQQNTVSWRSWVAPSLIWSPYSYSWGLVLGLSGKESACNAGVTGSGPLLGRSPGGRNGNPLQSSCLEDSMDKGAWWAIVHRVAKSQTQLKQLSMHAQLTGR